MIGWQVPQRRPDLLGNIFGSDTVRGFPSSFVFSEFILLTHTLHPGWIFTSQMNNSGKITQDAGGEIPDELFWMDHPGKVIRDCLKIPAEWPWIILSKLSRIIYPDEQVTEGMEGEFSCQARNLAGLGTKCDVKVALSQIWVEVRMIKSDQRTGGRPGCRNRLLILAFWRRHRPSPFRCHRCVNHTMQVNGNYHIFGWSGENIRWDNFWGCSSLFKRNFVFKNPFGDAIWMHNMKW